MVYRIQIFCASPQIFDFSEIVNFLDEGCYFDDLKILSHSEMGENVEDKPKNLEIIYEENLPPIVVSTIMSANKVEKEKEELIFILDISKKTSTQQNIRKKLDSTSQVFILEFSKELISDDCWEMLDSIESFLASRYDGIIYDPNDGFFDKNLRHIYKL
jgi:hypothetical protein